MYMFLILLAIALLAAPLGGMVSVGLQLLVSLPGALGGCALAVATVLAWVGPRCPYGLAGLGAAAVGVAMLVTGHGLGVLFVALGLVQWAVDQWAYAYRNKSYKSRFGRWLSQVLPDRVLPVTECAEDADGE